MSFMMSTFIQKSTYINTRRTYAPVKFDLSHVAFFMTSVGNFDYTSLCVSANRFVGSAVILQFFAH
jgi:hypothetical protein